MNRMRRNHHGWFEAVLHVILYLLCCQQQAIWCLYEDQIGKFDWRHQFIGRVDHVLRASDIWQDHQLLIASTHSGSLSGLYLRNGSINWRHLLETTASPLNLLTGWPASGPESAGFSCPILTVNGNGRWIRCWRHTGVLLAEHYLPNDFLVELEKDPAGHQLLFDIAAHQTADPALMIVKISPSTYLFELFQYNFRTRKLLPIMKITSGKWLDHSRCWLLTSRHLLCVDQTDRSFQFLDLDDPGSSQQFKRIPLSTFGLTQTSDATGTLTVHVLPDTAADKTTTLSKMAVAKTKYFALNLGDGQGVVMFKVMVGGQQEASTSAPAGTTIRLAKIFPYAVRVTIIPLISSVMESENPETKVEFGVAVLYTKPEPIPYEDKNDAQYQQKVFGLKLAIFHLETWTEITSISSQSILLEFGGKNSVPPVASNGKLAKRLDDRWSIDLFEIIPIRSVAHNVRASRDQHRYTYKMVLATEDGTLVVTNLMGKVNWAREEALAEIDSLVMIDLPLSETDATLEQEYGFDEQNANIVSMFVHRIRSQMVQLVTYIRHMQHWFTSSVHRLNAKRSKTRGDLEDLLDQDESTDPADQDQEEDETLIRDYFGFHKVIVARTKIGKIFAVDTLTGRIVWSRYVPSLKLPPVMAGVSSFPIWVQRTNAHYPYGAICTILNSQELSAITGLFSFDPVTGAQLDSRHLPFRVVQAMLVQTVIDSEFRRPILMLDQNFHAWLYPDTDEIRTAFADQSHRHYMMLVNGSTGSISGFRFESAITVQNAQQQPRQPEARPVWSFRLPHDLNKLIAVKTVFKRPHERVHSLGRVLGDRNVLYKYLNPNLAAVLCESLDTQEKSLITMYLIDAVTGNVVYSVVHRRARGPTQIVHSENWVIYSYYNEKMRRNEISAIDLYEGYQQINSTAFSSLGRDLTRTLTVEQKAFIFPTGIGIMHDTETLKGITSKHILISLPTGGILELPRAFLDPRRPIKPLPEHAEEGLIPYVPELPIPSETIINYNQTVFAVAGIVTAPASLESTSLVCVYGIDIYYTRVAPSKTFDILKDDFDHLLILAVLSALIIMSWLARYLAAKKSLNAAWK